MVFQKMHARPCLKRSTRENENARVPRKWTRAKAFKNMHALESLRGAGRCASVARCENYAPTVDDVVGPVTNDYTGVVATCLSLQLDPDEEQVVNLHRRFLRCS